MSDVFPHLIGSRIGIGQDLRYVLFPEWLEDASLQAGFAADATILDLAFTDGSRLSDLGLRDQHGAAFTADGQHSGAVLHPDQWNVVRVSLDAAAGQTVERVELRFSDLGLPAERAATGWVDTAAIVPSVGVPERPAERVRTRQGTLSSRRLSRGGSVPAVGLPNGFISGVPVTNARDSGWPYSWHADNDADNRPRIQAFATSHLASPWMAERGAFHVMPMLVPLDGAEPRTAPEARALAFSHDREIAHPHHYRVELEGGITAELTAAEHTVLVRLRFPSDDGIVMFDQIAGAGAFFLPEPGGPAVITGYTDDQHGGADRRRAPRSFLHATLDRPVVAARMSDRRLADGSASSARGWVRIALGEDRTVVVRLGSSLISVDQAARNIGLDGADEPFDDVRERVARAWDDWIGRVELAGATPDQQLSMATALYRVGMFPRRGHENLGTAANPSPHYANPFVDQKGATAVSAGVPLRAGELSVDQGFWDVYRTSWPLYCLIGQDRAPRLLEGFVEHFRANGWTSRWSAPGPIDSMTGTSSDIVFAHAVEAGVATRTDPADARGSLDLWAAFDSALRNATVPSDDSRVGRKGMQTSVFRGWVSTSTHEGLTWSLDGAINDLAVARLADTLRDRVSPAHPRYAELEACSTYFRLRSGRHALVFDRRIGFYLGRDDDGAFRLAPEEFDPAIWGFDYTETNGWGTAFSAPHDGAGLAALHGGPEALADKLEEFFATPISMLDRVRGSYPEVIHEMLEARNLRLGQWAPSNQPAHHIPYMALFARRPDLTQRIVHEAASRLFSGGEIGQGWPGDEDNGEMSAWWIFAALGLYPLVPGSAGYVLTAPLFRRSRLRVAENSFLTIESPDAAADRPYIRAVTLDGEPWTSTFLPHDCVAGGATVQIEVSDQPQAWGTRDIDAPPSLTPTGQSPLVPRDLTHGSVVSSSHGEAQLVNDDSAATGGIRLDTGGWVEFELATLSAPELLTVTVRGAARIGFRLEALGEDTAPTQRWTETFQWDGQTRPFLLNGSRARRWRWVAETPVDLLQLELLVSSSGDAACSPH